MGIVAQVSPHSFIYERVDMIAMAAQHAELRAKCLPIRPKSSRSCSSINDDYTIEVKVAVEVGAIRRRRPHSLYGGNADDQVMPGTSMQCSLVQSRSDPDAKRTKQSPSF